MKRIILTVVSTILLFSVFTVFSKPNPNSASSYKRSNIRVDQFGVGAPATPEVVKARLEALSCEVDMTYSKDVQDVIDKYLKYGDRHFQELLSRCAYYMPIFERALKEAGLPDELKYLPIIESNLKPQAVSYAGAGGLWQFMPVTAKGYNMTISSSIDERNDPYLSSEMACRVLKSHYDRFGDWGLALAAYNAGAGTIQKALKRAGGDPKEHTFWTVYNYLPGQTKKYVPKFIAMTYLMNYYQMHNISEVSKENVLRTDTIHVHEKLRLSQIAKSLDVSLDELKSLNPHFRGDVIPATASRHCNLILPVDQVKQYKESKGMDYVPMQVQPEPEIVTASFENHTDTIKFSQMVRRRNR